MIDLIPVLCVSLLLDHLLSGLEDAWAPCARKRVCLVDDVEDLCLELLLCLLELDEQVVADGTLLDQVGERRLVLAELEDPPDVGHRPQEERRLEKRLGRRRSRLEEGDVCVSGGVRGEPRHGDCFGWWWR